jgi:hypothetical protein
VVVVEAAVGAFTVVEAAAGAAGGAATGAAACGAVVLGVVGVGCWPCQYCTPKITATMTSSMTRKERLS